MARMYFLGNSTPTQMLGIVIVTETKTIVFDGGTRGDHQQLAKLLKEEGNGRVDGWFFTHPHADHIGAFVEICEKHPEITVDRIFCNFPAVELLRKYELRTEDESALWEYFEEAIYGRFHDRFHRVERGDCFIFDGLYVFVVRVFNPEIKTNYVNNSSCVYRIHSPNKKVLILGDLGIEGGREVQKMSLPGSLYADYTQLAHHGQNGVEKEFYEFIRPQCCLWAAPDWLWDNNSGGGIGSGPWSTLQTRAWMEELGVTQHIVEKDGTTVIPL